MNQKEQDRQEVSRRSLLRGTVGVILGTAGSSFLGAKAVGAQVEGLEPNPEVPVLRLSAGALTYRDRKQYIHNMETEVCI